METAGNVIRQHLRGTSDAVKSALPTEYNMKRQVNRYRHKTRGHPAASATCARDVEIPLSSESGHSDGGLFVLDDVITSNGKRVVCITSDNCRMILNQKHKLIFIDGTFNSDFTQIWIIRGFVGNTCVPLMYFLIEDTTCLSYSTALDILKLHCPDFDSESFMVDFEKAEHSAIRSQFINALIKGCLFHWKQCLRRKFTKIAGYRY